jgi:predicted enzyme related to lactoylglutathione lyase
MNRLILIISIAIIFISCNHTSKTNKKINKMDKQKNEASTKDTIPKVIGIGGIFFYSDNLKETKEWYTKNLGIEINDWGSSSFESRNLNRPDEINSLQWKPFNKGDEYFSPSKKDFMINYQVQNIEGLVNKLKENGVTILDSIATYDFGKFVHIMDAEGNKIELWEP